MQKTIARPKPDRTKVHPVCRFLKQERYRRDWTLAMLAEKTGMALQMISAYERGIYQPGLVNLSRWAAAFGFNVNLTRDPWENR